MKLTIIEIEVPKRLIRQQDEEKTENCQNLKSTLKLL